MSVNLKYLVRSKRRVFDGFFKLDELIVSHQQFDGTMSKDKAILVFERGDAAAAILYNRDTDQVTIVDQFKAPTLGKGRGDGWIVETLAGMVQNNETPEKCVIRETFEETGYRIEAPELVATFFSSPGGSSERIYLYFAAVTNDDKVGKGGGRKSEGEDIRVTTIGSAALFRQLESGELEDPKIIIAAYHLRDRVGSRRKYPPMPPGVQRFVRREAGRKSQLVIQTGDILKVRNVDVWVNSENTDMLMDRIIGKSISASIRFGGSVRDGSLMTEDTIANELRSKLGRRTFVKLGTVIETAPGALVNNEVKRIMHIATAQGTPRGGVKTPLDTIKGTVSNALEYLDNRNQSLIRRRMRSVLVPMIGAGDGGNTVEEVAPLIVGAAHDFFTEHPQTAVCEIHLLAFTERDRDACLKAINALEAYEPVPV